MEITRNIMDVLRERGFIKQVVREEDLYKLLGSESVPFYIGFDPTADSLHVGHFMQLMVMRVKSETLRAEAICVR